MGKATKDHVTGIAEALGWTVRFCTQTRNAYDGRLEKYAEFSQFSPAGQDYSFVVFYDALREIPEKVFETWDNFDIDEEVALWLEAKRNGVSGVPSVVDLVKDQQDIEQMLYDLWSALRNKL